jgi:hypothetical protein
MAEKKKGPTILQILQHDNLTEVINEVNSLHAKQGIRGIFVFMWTDEASVLFRASGISSKDLIYQMEATKAKVIAEDQAED